MASCLFRPVSRGPRNVYCHWSGEGDQPSSKGLPLRVLPPRLDGRRGKSARDVGDRLPLDVSGRSRHRTCHTVPGLQFLPGCLERDSVSIVTSVLAIQDLAVTVIASSSWLPESLGQPPRRSKLVAGRHQAGFWSMTCHRSITVKVDQCRREHLRTGDPCPRKGDVGSSRCRTAAIWCHRDRWWRCQLSIGFGRTTAGSHRRYRHSHVGRCHRSVSPA